MENLKHTAPGRELKNVNVMNIKFIKAEVKKFPTAVLAYYTIDDIEFAVEWNSIHPGTGETGRFDLQIEPIFSPQNSGRDNELFIRIADSIANGETDDENGEIYLALLNTFNSNDAALLVESKVTYQYNESVIGYTVSIDERTAANAQFEDRGNNCHSFVLDFACEGDETHEEYTKDELTFMRSVLRADESVRRLEDAFDNRAEALDAEPANYFNGQISFDDIMKYA